MVNFFVKIDDIEENTSCIWLFSIKNDKIELEVWLIV